MGNDLLTTFFFKLNTLKHFDLAVCVSFLDEALPTALEVLLDYLSDNNKALGK